MRLLSMVSPSTRLALAGLALVSCKTVSNDGRVQPATIASDGPKPAPVGAAARPADAGNGRPEEPEEPLAWGTRPAATGALFPVVDGMCVHGEIWPSKGSAIYTYGNGTGAWTRGGQATVARFADGGLDVSDAVTKSDNAEAWAWIAPIAVTGTWPSPLLLFSADQGNGRTRDYMSIWSHGEGGWTLLASHREGGSPGYSMPVVFKGHAIASRWEYDQGGDPQGAVTIKTWPVEKGAPAIAGVSSLARAKFNVRTLAAGDDTVYALGDVEVDAPGQFKRRNVIRVLSGGKVAELAVPDGEMRVVGARPSLVVAIDGAKVLRLEEGKLAPIALPAGTKLASGAIAPSGDVWLLTTKKTVIVARRDPTRTERIEETPLPAPASPRPKEAVMHWPTSGDLLGGVDVDDPYAIGEGGALFHFSSGRWSEVELPAPPFAASGRYQAQAVVVPTKGDVYVNAGYAEKGVGWKTAERYRAVLRNKRPKEVLRCNEPSGGSNGGSGSGFMSFPPIATDACKTPFVILLRLGYDVTKKGSATYVYDRKSDYPSVRQAIKATPGLGPSVDLVELVSGDQRYLGARVANVAAGRDLAQAVAKKVTGFVEVRPEVVCGTPREERVIQVDVATGKVASPVGAQ